MVKVEIKIKSEKGWDMPLLKDIAPLSLMDFVVRLKDQESVVKISTDNGEVFLVGVGKWYDYFNVTGKPVFKLQSIFEAFGVADMKHIAKVFPEAELWLQEGLKL